jgi:hypothetical protein
VLRCILVLQKAGIADIALAMRETAY